jgi:hypothetical protein
MSELSGASPEQYRIPAEELPVTLQTINSLRDVALAYLRSAEELIDDNGIASRTRLIGLDDGRDLQISSTRLPDETHIDEIDIVLNADQDSAYIDASLPASDPQISMDIVYTISHVSDGEETSLAKAVHFDTDQPMPHHEQLRDASNESDIIRTEEVSDLEELDDQSVREPEAAKLLELINDSDLINRI